MKGNGFTEILAVGALIVLSFFTGRWTAPEAMPLIQTHYELDTVTVTKKATVVKDSIIYRDIPADIDSLEVAQNYYADHPFTISTETNDVKVEAKGVISQNSFDTLFVDITNYRPTAILRPALKNSILIGAEAGRGLFAIKASYRYQDWELGIGYDVLTENQIGLLAEVKYRIKTW